MNTTSANEEYLYYRENYDIIKCGKHSTSKMGKLLATAKTFEKGKNLLESGVGATSFHYKSEYFTLGFVSLVANIIEWEAADKMSIQSTTQKTPIVDKGLDATTIKKL